MVRPMLARMTISVITIISSISVKPRRRDRPALPVMGFRPVKTGAVALRVHVEDVLPTPPRRIGFVLIGPQAPFVRVGHRIDRDPPQVLQLYARRVVRL